MTMSNKIPGHVVQARNLGIASIVIGLISVPLYWSDGVAMLGITGQILLAFLPPIILSVLYVLAYRRKNWARIVLLVLLGLWFPFHVIGLFTPCAPMLKLVQISQFVLFYLSFTMLLTASSRAWFRSS